MFRNANLPVPPPEMAPKGYDDPDLFEQCFGTQPIETDDVPNMIKACVILNQVFGLGAPPQLETCEELNMIQKAAQKMCDKDNSISFAISMSMGVIGQHNSDLVEKCTSCTQTPKTE
jgi:hypothetical protein